MFASDSLMLSEVLYLQKQLSLMDEKFCWGELIIAN